MGAARGIGRGGVSRARSKEESEGFLRSEARCCG